MYSLEQMAPEKVKQDDRAETEMKTVLADMEQRLRHMYNVLELEDGEAPVAESMEDVQKLLAMAIRLYAAHYQAGGEAPIFGPMHGVSATDVMVASTEMLKAVNVQLFELGMYQTWSSHSH
jgi:hypothetical protein